MNQGFSEVSVDSLTMNPFAKIGSQWMLVTSGGIDSWNTMTASWGGLGVIWHRNVSYVFVRYSRFTYEFMEKNNTFTLSFFSEKYREALSYCGSHSGREVDKTVETGLEPFSSSINSVSFKQAELILVCRKLYAGGINPEDFIDPTVQDNYKTKDYHKMYIGEIEKVLSAGK
ncbi:MAG: flavin reductase [Spirochaetales bacterium]|nr:flavin reductase [Spirochaetales bacterium]